MRRPFAIVLCWVVGLTAAFAGAQETRPATRPTTTPTAATTQSTRPATQPGTQPAATPDADRQARQKAENDRRTRTAKFAAALASARAEADSADVDLASATSVRQSSGITAEVDGALPSRRDEINATLVEVENLLKGSTPLETLNQQSAMLAEDMRQLNEWQGELTRRRAVLADGLTKLETRQDHWLQTRSMLTALAAAASGDPTTGPSTRDATDPLATALARIDGILQKNEEQRNLYYYEQQRSESLNIQITSLQNNVSLEQRAVANAQREARGRLFEKDSPALWQSLLHPMAYGDVTEQGVSTAVSQWQALTGYVARQGHEILVHFLIVAVLAAALIWLRRQTVQWVGNDPVLLETTRVFQTPIATAITASMIATPWIYIAAPRLFWGIVGTSALIPTIVTLRPLTDRSLRPLLYGLAAAIFVNLVLSIVAALPIVYQALQLGQMGGAAVFFLWFLRVGRGGTQPAAPAAAAAAGPAAGTAPPDTGRLPLRRAVVVGCRLGLAITVVAAFANILGFLGLARLISNALLTSAYLGVLLDTSVAVGDALLLGVSHVRPVSTLGMVQRHRTLLLGRLHLVMLVIAAGVWGFFTLESLQIRQPVFDAARAVWNWPKGDTTTVAAKPADGATADQTPAVTGTPAGAIPTSQPTTLSTAVLAATQPAVAGNPGVVVGGSNNTVTVNNGGAPASGDAAAKTTGTDNGAGALLYVGGVILFVLSIVASIYTARFVAFLLDEDVYPRLKLARGMPYAISTLLRYVILAVGFSLAIVNLGYGDPTKLTILVSAFSIGLGFGLQNIVNNFVSGLILLFERPVQVGDVIELDNFTGVVSRIGIRASIIRTPLAAEIIVPNGRLISDRVINWTLSNRQRGVEVSLTVAPGVEPQKLIALLCSTAKGLPMVASYPAPTAYFTDFSGGGMKFEVRAWTNRFEDWAQVRSELAVAINAMLVKENVTLK